MPLQNRRKEITHALYKPIMFLFNKSELSSILNRMYLIPCSHSRKILRWTRGPIKCTEPDSCKKWAFCLEKCKGTSYRN